VDEFDNSPRIWCGIILLLSIRTMANAFSRPILSIFITRSSPSRAQLGTINGANQALTALCRSLGPSIAGLVYSTSLEVGKPWIVWRLGLCIWASGLFVAGWFLTDPEVETASAAYAPVPQQDEVVEERHESEVRSSAVDECEFKKHNRTREPLQIRID
jgi:hypothetical protein